MANTSRKQKPLTKSMSVMCLKCGEKIEVRNLYSSKSSFYTTYMKIPLCKDCIDDMYQEYYKKYKGEGYTNPERKAIERLCMVFDVYYDDSIVTSIVVSDISLMRYTTHCYIEIDILSERRLQNVQ